MKATVIRLRERGKRLRDRETSTDQAIAGDMTLAAVGPIIELKLSDLNDSQLKPLIPILYEAQLVTMHGNTMLFRGYEKGPDGAGYVQEWTARINQPG